MSFKITLPLVLGLAIALPAVAQHQHTPYAEFQQRKIKALSDQQIADLRAGRGMGYALAGELNGYPGPLHVLELADKLQLTDQQLERVQQLFDSMKTEAVTLGEKLIEQESALDRAFAEHLISPTSLSALTSQIGQTQADLRAVHLKYHLVTAELLTTHQKHVYSELRGYR